MAERTVVDSDQDIYNNGVVGDEEHPAGSIRYLVVRLARNTPTNDPDTRQTAVTVRVYDTSKNALAGSTKTWVSDYNVATADVLRLYAGLSAPDFAAGTMAMRFRIHHGTLDIASELPDLESA